MVVRGSSFVVRRSSFVVGRWPLGVRRYHEPPPTTHQPPTTNQPASVRRRRLALLEANLGGAGTSFHHLEVVLHGLRADLVWVRATCPERRRGVATAGKHAVLVVRVIELRVVLQQHGRVHRGRLLLY